MERIELSKIYEITDLEKYEFPKYTTQLINLANQNSGGTRPKIVGQMSELIQQCPQKEIHYWIDWYVSHYPTSIDKATDIILAAVNNLKIAINKIDREMINKWVKDLVFYKTAMGLIFQDAILKSISEKYDLDYRLAMPEEEARGIDGIINNKPVSIKPESYKSKTSVKHEELQAPVIYYKVTSKYLSYEIPTELF